MQNSIPVF